MPRQRQPQSPSWIKFATILLSNCLMKTPLRRMQRQLQPPQPSPCACHRSANNSRPPPCASLTALSHRILSGTPGPWHSSHRSVWSFSSPSTPRKRSGSPSRHVPTAAKHTRVQYVKPFRWGDLEAPRGTSPRHTPARAANPRGAVEDSSGLSRTPPVCRGQLRSGYPCAYG